jgi:uncharacterized phage protein (TIGR02218 family)
LKTFAAIFLNHLLGRTTTLCTCYRIIRKDGLVFGRNDGTRAFDIDGVTYAAATGLHTTAVQKSDTITVDTIDVTAFMDDVDEGEIEAGLWDAAKITIFEVNYNDLPTTFILNRMNVMRDGILGKVDRQDQRFTAEIRSKMARFDTHFGAQYTITCPWTLGDPLTCGVNLASFTFPATVTIPGANPRTNFTASGLSQKPGYFAQGRVEFLTGANAGHGMDVRHWNNHRFDLNRPLPYAVAVGDTFNAIIGDDHTFETCRDVFHNVQRFRGFHFLPGIDKLLENPVHWKRRPVPKPPPDNDPDNDPNNDPSDDGE